MKFHHNLSQYFHDIFLNAYTFRKKWFIKEHVKDVLDDKLH